MNKEQHQRYSRHMLLPQFGHEGQERLLTSRVLVVGVGGLGSPVAMYLAASGVGHLVIADFDHVELSNLQRQIVHGTESIGVDKVESAKATIRKLNPDCRVTPLAYTLDDEELDQEVADADVVVDATDNFESRFSMNAACWRHRTPLVSGAAIRFDGQVSVFDPRRDDSPCYRCLYTDVSNEGEACAEVGVFSPLLGIIGSIQAAETLKLLIDSGDPMVGRLLIVDALTMEFRELKLAKDPACPVCQSTASTRHRA